MWTPRAVALSERGKAFKAAASLEAGSTEVGVLDTISAPPPLGQKYPIAPAAMSAGGVTGGDFLRNSKKGEVSWGCWSALPIIQQKQISNIPSFPQPTTGSQSPSFQVITAERITPGCDWWQSQSLLSTTNSSTKLHTRPPTLQPHSTFFTTISQSALAPVHIGSEGW